MLNEIINKYENFSDSLVLEMLYNTTSKNLEAVIKCMNKLNDYEFETIKIFFSDVISVRFVEKQNQSSTSINSALLTSNNEIITFDFFPLIYGNSDLHENKYSDFMIKCKQIGYKVIG
ncbi:hypothetical protein [Pedobacter caeni]|uniref:Uncharacterized protein n=1 Tax=Pedobacter caeni TaxID=288992 RepID=A0A1M5HIL2_9SPHI|nr:hypothetical protein [Pedobacter caeni]SHG15814.1 hypothetical protein SAMN04488522_104680 [Pedobacter caeni]